MLTDEQLIEAYSNGDTRAFEELFERYRAKIFQFTLRMLGNRNLAEDTFQEIFLRVHSKLTRYKSEERFPAWLFTIAHRACIDAHRKRKREGWLLFGTKIQEQVSGAAGDPEMDFAREQLREKIMAKLKHLNGNQKQVFLLRIHGNLLFREIAALLKVPLNTVLVQYHQAVLALKESLKEQL